jgi:hypothetical protein
MYRGVKNDSPDRVNGFALYQAFDVYEKRKASFKICFETNFCAGNPKYLKSAAH